MEDNRQGEEANASETSHLRYSPLSASAWSLKAKKKENDSIENKMSETSLKDQRPK